MLRRSTDGDMVIVRPRAHVHGVKFRVIDL